MSNNKNFVINNPVEVGGVISTPVGTVISTTSNDNYNLVKFSYSNISFDISSQGTSPSHLKFGDNGTKMYFVNSPVVYQYTLLTAWDLSSATYANKSFNFSGQEAVGSAVAFSDDGYKMYVMGYSNDGIFQYSLSTAWDVSTASYDSVSFDTTTLDNTAWDLQFKPDGTKAYVYGLVTRDIFQCSLSTAWDLSTLSYDSVSFTTLTTQDSDARGICFSSDGTRMYMVGVTTDTIYEYSLSTAWDLSTASYSGISLLANQDTTPYSITINDDGSRIYTIGSGSDSVYQYDAGLKEDVTVDLSTGNSFEFSVQNDATFSFTNPSESQSFDLTVSGNIRYDLDSIEFVYSGNHSPTTYDYFNQGLGFSSDGRKLYIIQNYYLYCRERTLSTPWDISTVSSSGNVYDYGADGYNLSSFFIHPEGTMFFSCDTNLDTVIRWDLSSPYDISTQSYNQQTPALGTNTYGLTFKPDGTEMYVSIKDGAYKLVQYSLSTAWDLSTATYTTQFVGPQQWRTLVFNPEGTILIGGDTGSLFNKYVLSTAWDINSASFDSSGSPSVFISTPSSWTASPDGENIYSVQDSNSGTAGIVQYSTIGTPTITFPTSVNTQNGSSLAPLNKVEVNKYSLSTKDNGTTYSGRTSFKNIS